VDERLYHKVEENYELFQSLSQRYNIDLKQHIIQPTEQEIRMDVSATDGELRYFGCLNSQKYINSLEQSLTYEPENPIVIKGSRVVRPIF